MHIPSSLVALALGLAPVWAIPMKDPSEFETHPGAIPLESFKEIEKGLPVLKPRLAKRDPKARPDFSLKKDIVLNWDDGEEDIIKAELTANWKEQDEVTVLNLADFADAIENVDCKAPTLSLVFKQDSLLKEAQKNWEWINGDAKNNIILFANHPSCDEVGKAGAGFRVTGIKYQTKGLIASLAVEEIDNLETVIPDGELVVDTLADIDEPVVEAPRDEDDPEENDPKDKEANPQIPDTPKKVNKRWSASVTPTVSLATNFNNKNIFSLGSGSNYLKLDCTTCGSRGKIKIKLYARISWLKVQESYIEFRAEDVQAFINLKLHGQAARNWQGHKVLIPITAYGFQIPSVATLRLAADIGVGYDAALLGQGQVTWGATASLTNPSVRRECFKGCSDYKSGWQIATVQNPPAGSGGLMAKISAHVFITPKAEARIFSAGYEVGVALLAPKFDGQAFVQANSAGGICAVPNAILGVEVDLKLGLQCYAYAGPNYQSPRWRKDIYERMWTLYDQCFVLARN